MSKYQSPPAGELDTPVRLEHRDLRKADDGSLKPQWSLFAELYVSIQPLGGREQWQAGAAGSEASHRIISHWIPGVTPKMRVVNGEQKLYLTSVVNPGQRCVSLELLASESEPSS